MSQHFEFTRTGVWTWLTSGSWLKGHITAFERSQCQEVASGSCSSLQSKWRVGFSVSLNSHTNQQKCPISSSSNFESVITSLDASIPMYIYIYKYCRYYIELYIYIYLYVWFLPSESITFSKTKPFLWFAPEGAVAPFGVTWERPTVTQSRTQSFNPGKAIGNKETRWKISHTSEKQSNSLMWSFKFSVFIRVFYFASFHDMSWYYMIPCWGAYVFFERSLMIGQFAVSCVFMVFKHSNLKTAFELSHQLTFQTGPVCLHVNFHKLPR